MMRFITRLTLIFININVLNAQNLSRINEGAVMDNVTHLMANNQHQLAIQKIDSVLQAMKIQGDTLNAGILDFYFLKAHCFYGIGRMKDAIELGNLTLNYRKKLAPDGLLNISKSHNNLGIYYRKTGELNKSLFHNKSALSIRYQIYGEMHQLYAKSCGNLGNLYLDLLRFDSALIFKQKAHEIYVKLFGENAVECADATAGIGLVFQKMEDYSNAEKCYLKAQGIYDSLSLQNTIGTEWLYNNLGAVYAEWGRFEESIKYHKLALAIREKFYGKNNSSCGISLNNLGISCVKSGNLLEAKKYFDRALAVLKTSQGDKSLLLGTLYNDMGGYFLAISDYDMAIEYITQALSIRSEKLGEDHPLTAYPYYNLSLSHLSKGDYDLAKKYSRKALQVRQKNNPQPNIEIAESYLNMGMLYSRLGDNALGLFYYDSALAILKSKLPICSPKIAVCQNNIAQIYLRTGEIKKALLVFQECLNCKVFMASSYILRSSTLSGMARCFSALRDYEKADSLFRVALLLGTNQSDQPNLSIVEFATVLDATLLYNDFKFYQYSTERETRFLYTIDQTSRGILENYGVFIKGISNAAHEEVLSKYMDVACDAVRCHLQLFQRSDSLHDLHRAFDAAERSKSMLLYQAMQNNNAVRIAGIPDSLIQREYELRVRSTYFEKLLEEIRNNGVADGDSAVFVIQKKLFELNRKSDTLKFRFEHDYPKYYQVKYALETTPVREVQTDLLTQNQSMLEYLVGDSVVFIYLVRHDTFLIKEIPLDFPLERWVTEMTKAGISGYYGQKSHTPGLTKIKSIENYSRAAYQLYEKLWMPVAEFLTEKVIIIPDGVLGYVPFEALLTNLPPERAVGKFSYYDFLIKKHQISYCYSASLLREMQNKSHQKQQLKGTLAMAPFFLENVQKLDFPTDTLDLRAEGESLDTLMASGDEVAAVAEIMGGSAFYGQEASLSKFMEAAANYGVIHLSTHGKADDRTGDYAFLAFVSPQNANTYDKLYARDLYNFTLNADMVVLSACETGLGKLRKGEGIVSLSRAFAYAGAKSIFPTLWQVSDAKTAELMQYFYKFLRSGQAKDEALRNAKRNFLSQNSGENLHPFFWAGMIGVGDMRPLKP